MAKVKNEAIEFAEFISENHYYLYNVNLNPKEYQWKSQEFYKKGNIYTTEEVYTEFKKQKNIWQRLKAKD